MGFSSSVRSYIRETGETVSLVNMKNSINWIMGLNCFGLVLTCRIVLENTVTEMGKESNLRSIISFNFKKHRSVPNIMYAEELVF